MAGKIRMIGRDRAEIARTGKGLRDALFDQLEKLSNGDIDHQDARAFAGIAHALIKTVEVQLKYEQMVKRGELTSKETDVMDIGNEPAAQIERSQEQGEGEK